jgi:FkbM family methyltransferase
MKKFLKYSVSLFVDFLAWSQGYFFPKDFLWYWRLDLLLERYEVETTRFFKQHLKKGMTVIDVGANFGYYSRLAARRVGKTGRVYAFEADAENFAYLVKNTKKFANITPLNMAVTDHSGMVPFFHFTGASSSGVHSTLPADGAERRQIAGISLDDFVAQEHIAHVDILKIDVEGAEPQVFAGMQKLLTQKPQVVFEYTPETSQALLTELQKQHTIYTITPEGKLASLSEMTFKVGKREYANLVLSDGVK